MRLRVLVLAAGILCPASGFAEEFQFPTFLSGNKLLEACTPVQLPFCYGYVEGVADALQSTFSALHMQQHALFCLPQGSLRGSLWTLLQTTFVIIPNGDTPLRRPT